MGLLSLSYWAIDELVDEGIKLVPDHGDWIAPILAEFASLAAAVSTMAKAAQDDWSSPGSVDTGTVRRIAVLS
jgi:hypothetical protein